MASIARRTRSRVPEVEIPVPEVRVPRKRAPPATPPPPPPAPAPAYEPPIAVRGTRLVMSARPTDTVGMTRARLAEAEGWYVQNVGLYYGVTRLADDAATLAHYGVKPGTEIRMLVLTL